MATIGSHFALLVCTLGVLGALSGDLGVPGSPPGTILGVLLVLLRALSDHLRGNLGSTRRYHAFHMVYDFVLVSFGV